MRLVAGADHASASLTQFTDSSASTGRWSERDANPLPPTRDASGRVRKLRLALDTVIDGVACSGDTSVMRDNCFAPTAHQLGAGTTVTVVNEGVLPHTLTAVDGSFDTGILEPGESATIEVGEEGIVPFYCTLHSSPAGEGMAGMLLVGEPTPESVGAISELAGLRRTIEGQTDAVTHTLDEQAGSLATIERDLDELRGTLATSGDGPRDWWIAVAGLVGRQVAVSETPELWLPATVLATAPWWVIGLCIVGVVLVGFLVAMRDNLLKLTAPKPAPLRIAR